MKVTLRLPNDVSNGASNVEPSFRLTLMLSAVVSDGRDVDVPASISKRAEPLISANDGRLMVPPILNLI